jgi:hypothetical protein
MVVSALRSWKIDGNMNNAFIIASAAETIQGYSKRSIHFQKFILQKPLTLNPCPVYRWKGNLSKF